MSDNIPFEIQIDIIQRIPDTKWVIRCRSVSKAWKSTIDSREFVAAHTLRHQSTQPHHLFIRKRDWSDEKVKYVSIVDDDDTFPHQKVSVFVPDLVHEFSSDSEIIGTSHGLFCLYEYGLDTAVIWNPSIRKTVIWNPSISNVFGFGVCPRNLDPKLVKISYVHNSSKLQDVNASTQVEVFNLSSGGTWRSPLSSNLPHKSIRFWYSQAVVDGFIYWDAVDRNDVDLIWNRNLIMSFDLTSEEFTKVNLPDPLTNSRYANLSVSNLRESLALLKFNTYTPREFCDVWTMTGHGCTRSFNKLYSIDASIGTTVGFRKSGAPIIEVRNDNEDFDHRALAIYEPESKTITNLGIHGFMDTFSVHSCMETLLLLDH